MIKNFFKLKVENSSISWVALQQEKQLYRELHYNKKNCFWYYAGTKMYFTNVATLVFVILSVFGFSKKNILLFVTGFKSKPDLLEWVSSTRLPLQWGRNKDAGFVYESLQIDTKQTFLTCFSYKTNPRNESFENCVTKRIHETNLLNTVVQNESTKRIFWTP